MENCPINAARDSDALLERFLKESKCHINGDYSQRDTKWIVRQALNWGRQDLLKNLGSGLVKFAPDLAADLTARWKIATDEEREAFERFLAFLKKE